MRFPELYGRIQRAFEQALKEWPGLDRNRNTELRAPWAE
jgi:hypothetical protein